ncbi:MAG: hypothetical protein HY584_01945 [Candidatus Omnitrophica bacterium]|nr:hypothetical protein [Candidatus Omnitrophota bacterium]
MGSRPGRANFEVLIDPFQLKHSDMIKKSGLAIDLPKNQLTVIIPIQPQFAIENAIN